MSLARPSPHLDADAPTLSWWERCQRWWRGEVAPELGEPFASDRHRRADSAPSAAPFSPVREMSNQGLSVMNHASDASAADFRIECIPLQQGENLDARVRAQCDYQAVRGLRLSSTFQHDGHAFLIFKRT